MSALGTLTRISLIMLALGAFMAYSQRLDEPSIATSQRVALEAMRLSATSPDVAAQLSVVAYWAAPTATALASLLLTTSRDIRHDHGSVTALDFAPTGEVVALAGADGAVSLWRVRDGRSPPARREAGPALISKIIIGRGRIHSVSFSSTGRLLAVATQDWPIQLWDVSRPAAPRLLPTRIDVTLPVYSVSFSPDGGSLAVASADGTVTLWRTAGLPELVRMQTLALGSTFARSVGFSAAGDTLIAGGQDGSIVMWSLRAGPDHPRTVTSSDSAAKSITMSGARFTTVAGRADGSVSLVDGAPASTATIAKATAPINSVAFRRDGRYLYAADGHGIVYYWSQEPRGLTWRLSMRTPISPIFALALSPDNRLVALGGAGGLVKLLAADPTQAVSALCARAPTSITPDEWGRYVRVLPYAPPCG